MWEIELYNKKKKDSIYLQRLSKRTLKRTIKHKEKEWKRNGYRLISIYEINNRENPLTTNEVSVLTFDSLVKFFLERAKEIFTPKIFIPNCKTSIVNGYKALLNILIMFAKWCARSYIAATYKRNGVVGIVTGTLGLIGVLWNENFLWFGVLYAGVNTIGFFYTNLLKLGEV